MPTHPRRLFYTVLMLGATLGALGLILAKGPLAPVLVETVTLQQGDLYPALFGVGTVEARRVWTIGPERNGRLMELQVDHGDWVEPGQRLGRMDPEDLPARLQAAAFSADKLQQQLQAARAQVAEARTRYRQAQKEAQRYRELLAKHQISREQAENRETEARALKDRLAAAQAERTGLRHEHQRALAEIRALRAQLDALVFRSPARALVVAREQEPGSVVTAGAPVLRLIDRNSLWVRTRIEQRNSAGLTTGLEADIELRQHPGRPLPGRVARLEWIADALTEERWVDVRFDALPSSATPAIGSLANVTIHLPPVKEAHWLPAAALHPHAGGMGIWLVRSGQAHFLPVETGVRTLDGRVQILSELPTDNRVVVHAYGRLREGRRVREKGS